ncbi:MAG: hypothetical protein HWE20_11915, partial [Gammaproteobacteria bacterium]|nr:hypothetical protein [Gammaproteobacteria bacterium]
MLDALHGDALIDQNLINKVPYHINGAAPSNMVYFGQSHQPPSVAIVDDDQNAFVGITTLNLSDDRPESTFSADAAVHLVETSAIAPSIADKLAEGLNGSELGFTFVVDFQHRTEKMEIFVPLPKALYSGRLDQLTGQYKFTDAELEELHGVALDLATQHANVIAQLPSSAANHLPANYAVIDKSIDPDAASVGKVFAGGELYQRVWNHQIRGVDTVPRLSAEITYLIHEAGHGFDFNHRVRGSDAFKLALAKDYLLSQGIEREPTLDDFAAASDFIADTEFTPSEYGSNSIERFAELYSLVQLKRLDAQGLLNEVPLRLSAAVRAELDALFEKFSNTIDAIEGHDDFDAIVAAQPETWHGTDGADALGGSHQDDQLLAGGGNDILMGEKGDDELYGGLGDDELFGGEGNDLLVGGDGADLLMGGEGDDTYANVDEADVIVIGSYGGHDRVEWGDSGAVPLQIDASVYRIDDFSVALVDNEVVLVFDEQASLTVPIADLDLHNTEQVANNILQGITFFNGEELDPQVLQTLLRLVVEETEIVDESESVDESEIVNEPESVDETEIVNEPESVDET